MNASPSYHVYFFLPLAEALSVPEQPYEFDISAPMAGTGRIQPSDPHPVDQARHTGSVSIVPRHVLVDDITDIDMSVNVAMMMSETVPWALQSNSVGAPTDDPPEPPELPKTRRTIIEASIIMPQGWVPYTAQDEDDFDPDLEAALDDAIEAINTLQNLDYAITKRATVTVSPQSLPLWILYVIGVRVSGVMQPAPGGSTGAYLNGAGREAHDLRRHSEEVDAESLDVPLTPYAKVVELMREADALRRLVGSYRSALIMTAATAESLMDITLMILMWESGKTPESCSPRFKDSVTTRSRVSSDFAPLLGGSWDHTAVDALRNWIDRIAKPRNQAVHFGLRVDRRAAEEAWAAFNSLRFWLGDRLWPKLEKYPFTTLTCFGSLGMSPSAEMITAMPSRYDPGESMRKLRSLERWIITLLALSTKQAREPDLTRGGLLAVALPGGGIAWIWHDWVVGKACLVTTDSATEMQTERRIRQSDWTGEYLAFSVTGQANVTQTGDWEEEHALVPGLQVLVDESDLKI